jgi:hypothetical protein
MNNLINHQTLMIIILKKSCWTSLLIKIIEKYDLDWINLWDWFANFTSEYVNASNIDIDINININISQRLKWNNIKYMNKIFF